MVAAAALWVVPFVWVIVISLKHLPEMYRTPMTFLPDDLLNSANYRGLIESGWGRYFLNSTFVVAAGVPSSLLFSTLSGYAFAKLEFPGRDIAFILVLAILMIPFEVTVVPLFLLFNTLGLTNTYLGLVGPQLMSAFGVFLMRQFIQAIPDDYLDAARMDGASELRLIWSVVVPLARPGLITLGIIKFLWIWNDFLWPLVITNNSRMYTLTVGLANLRSEQFVDYTVIAAAAVFSMIPVIIVFFTLQRYVTEGVVRAGIHG